MLRDSSSNFSACGLSRPGRCGVVFRLTRALARLGVRRLGQMATWWDGSRLPDLLEFGWQLGYRVRTFGDDRTAVCVWGQ